jgi:hypothetical protein
MNGRAAMPIRSTVLSTVTQGKVNPEQQFHHRQFLPARINPQDARFD